MFSLHQVHYCIEVSLAKLGHIQYAFQVTEAPDKIAAEPAMSQFATDHVVMVVL